MSHLDQRQAIQNAHPLTFDDLFAIQTIRDLSVSADGSIAVVITRARRSNEHYGYTRLTGYERSDIWLIPHRTGARRNITNGRIDASGSWAPLWSPDGSKLAFLSTKGNDNVRLYVWTARSGTIERLSNRGVDLNTTSELTGPPFVWIDNSKLLCAMVDEGDQTARFKFGTQMRRTIDSEWDKAEQGIYPTASMLEGGIPVPESQRTKGALLLIDTATKRDQELGQGNFSKIMVSPDRQFAAVIANTEAVIPSADRLLYLDDPIPTYRTWLHFHRKLGIVNLRQNSKVNWLSGVTDPGTYGHLLEWSADSSTVAVLGTTKTDVPSSLFLISVRGLQVVPVEPNMDFTGLAWTTDGLLAYGRNKTVQGSNPTSRNDWWLIGTSKNRQSVNVTANLSAVPLISGLDDEGSSPIFLLRVPGGHKVYGIASQNLWSFDLDTRVWTDLSADLGIKVNSIAWPESDDLFKGCEDIIVQTPRYDNQSGRLYLLHLNSRTPKTEIPLPHPAGTLVGYSSSRKLVVFSATTTEGAFVWVQRGTSGDAIEKIRLNEHLTRILRPRHVLVPYIDLDGLPRNALLLLPGGYTEGKRLPLVTWVYPDTSIESVDFPPADETQYSGFLQLQLLTSHGYAVLIPSMRPKKDGPLNPLQELPTGVIPAIDEVVKKGFADPNRIGVMGTSYGGYATYGVITQTHRFKAAVAISGVTDLTATYAAFDPVQRYTSTPHEFQYQAVEFDTLTPFMRMANPPWKDLDRYIRNSPLYFLDRVETPLLIVHSDLDFHQMQQADEFFSGLHRMGKRVRYVRYWGEWHTLESPANIKDMWEKIYDWFDTYLLGKASPAQPNAKN